MNWKPLIHSEEPQTMPVHLPCPRPGQTLLINPNTPAKPGLGPRTLLNTALQGAIIRELGLAHEITLSASS